MRTMSSEPPTACVRHRHALRRLRGRRRSWHRLHPPEHHRHLAVPERNYGFAHRAVRIVRPDVPGSGHRKHPNPAPPGLLRDWFGSRRLPGPHGSTQSADWDAALISRRRTTTDRRTIPRRSATTNRGTISRCSATSDRGTIPRRGAAAERRTIARRCTTADRGTITRRSPAAECGTIPRRRAARTGRQVHSTPRHRNLIPANRTRRQTIRAGGSSHRPVRRSREPGRSSAWAIRVPLGRIDLRTIDVDVVVAIDVDVGISAAPRGARPAP